MSNLKSKILSVVGPSILPKAKVVSNDAIGSNFRMIKFESESLRNSVWSPGSKVQINTGNWNMRTYTPISIDQKNGQMKILVYLTGTGPGSEWAKSLQPGQLTNFKGPDGMVNLSKSSDRVVLFGDETSFGLAAGIKSVLGPEAVIDFIFEVSSPEGSKIALVELNLSNAKTFPKRSGAGVVPALSEAILQLHRASNGIQFILSGRAQSIQMVRTTLQGAGLNGSQMLVKVYWSQGKAGLD
jgi:ferric-chelate reductase (NADPH)